MQKKKLISRLSWYGPLEKFHAFITFPGLLIFGIYHYDFQNIIFLSYGLLICIFILYQGQKYWKIKLDKLKNLPVNDSENLKFFKKSKRINRIFIIGIPLIFIVQLALDNWEIIPGRLLFFGILANVFAILEHVNYYHIQLMIDNSSDMTYVIRNKKLKTASLANDLRRGRF